MDFADGRAALIAREVQQAARRLWHARGYTSMVVSVLALCIGAVTAIFSVVYGVLLQPYGFGGRGQLVMWNETMREMSATMPALPINYRHFHYLEQHATTLDSAAMAASQLSSVASVSGQDLGHPELVRGLAVTGQFFRVLGTTVRGRDFLPSDYRAKAPAVAILTDATARQYFGSANRALGSTLHNDGVAMTVVGVMPAAFKLPVLPFIPGKSGSDRPYGIFIPFTPSSDDITESAGNYNYIALGRLKPGVTVPSAQTELDGLEKQVQKGDGLTVHLGVLVTPFQEAVTGGVSKALLLLLLAVGGVLLVGCVNLANLQLARSVSLAGEHALRSALGASTGRLVAESLSENLLLAFGGLSVALPLAWAGTHALVAMAPVELPRVSDIHLSLPVLGCAVFFSFVTSFLFGLVPAWRTATVDPARALGSGGMRVAGEGRSAERMRGALLAAEIACSIVLLAATGLLTQSFSRLLTSNLALDKAPVTLAEGLLSDPRYSDVGNTRINKGSSARGAFVDRSMHALESLPGVQSVAVTNALPLTGMSNANPILRPDHPVSVAEMPIAMLRTVSPGYFRTMGVDITSGRGFAETDRDGRHVAVLSASAARAGFGNESPIGHKILQYSTEYTVIGVAADSRIVDPHASTPVFYVPFWDYPPFTPVFVVRGVGVGADEIRKAIWSADSQVAIPMLLTLHAQTQRSIALEHFQAELVSAFGIVALLLASLGVYGVLSYAVVLRTREWGIRLALGSDRARLIGRAMRLAGVPALLGGIAGCFGATMMATWMRSLLFGLEHASPTPMTAIAAGAMGVAVMLAALPSALRAARTEPASVLRGE